MLLFFGLRHFDDVQFMVFEFLGQVDNCDRGIFAKEWIVVPSVRTGWIAGLDKDILPRE